MTNKKLILSFFVIFIIGILLTYNYVSNKYEQDYKIGWMGSQTGAKVTDFKVKANRKQLNIFNSTFDVEVTIKGTVFDTDRYVECVKKSERIVIIDNKMVAIIEFEPVFTDALLPYYNNNVFETKFKHTLSSYEHGNLVYIFRCRDFEKKIYINSNK